jgi:hypothetical protein
MSTQISQSLSAAEWTHCRTRGEPSHGNQKNPFPNPTSQTDVRKARMSLFEEKKSKNKKKRKLERDFLWHFSNRAPDNIQQDPVPA